jgi:hypothetical protein
VSAARLPIVPVEAISTDASRLPPFGREVIDAVAKAVSPNVYAFATRDAWDRAYRRRARNGLGAALVLPDGETAASYRWPIVPGGLLLVATGRSRGFAFETARAIVSFGTPLVAAIFGDSELLIASCPEWRARHE